MGKTERKFGCKHQLKAGMLMLGAVGAVTILSHDPDLPIDDIVKEFGLTLWDDYYARSVRLRGGPLPPSTGGHAK